MHIQPLPHMHTHTQEGQRERKCSMFCSHYVCDSDKAFLADLQMNTEIIELLCVHVCVCYAKSSLTVLQPYGLQPTKLLCSWDSPGKTIGVGCHSLLQGSFPTQESNLSLLHLLHCQVGSLPLHYQPITKEIEEARGKGKEENV